jgi:hydroxymethylglutaryl-CoA reductase
LALNLVLDGETIVVPMAVEEPSVIAAVSGAAKTICNVARDKGIETTCGSSNSVIAQITLHEIEESKINEAITRVSFEVHFMSRLNNM